MRLSTLPKVKWLIVSVLPVAVVATLKHEMRLATLSNPNPLIVSVLPVAVVATLKNEMRVATLTKNKRLSTAIGKLMPPFRLL